MNFKRLFYSETGKIIISILLGFGLATLFKKSCKERNCLVFKAPALNEIKNKVFKFGDKCYTFSEKAQKCVPNKKTVNFA